MGKKHIRSSVPRLTHIILGHKHVYEDTDMCIKY